MGYWSIDLDVVHTTAEQQLPGFAADLRRILDVVEAEGSDGDSDGSGLGVEPDAQQAT